MKPAELKQALEEVLAYLEQGKPEAAQFGLRMLLRSDAFELSRAARNQRAYRERKKGTALSPPDNAREQALATRDNNVANGVSANVSDPPPSGLPQKEGKVDLSNTSGEETTKTPHPPTPNRVIERERNVSAGVSGRSRSDEFNSNRLTELFSRMRKTAGGGAYQQKRSDYDRLQAAVEWARAELPADPESACVQSIGNYLRLATGSWADGWPFGGWANDPGRWLAAGKENAATEEERRAQAQRERVLAENRRIAAELERERQSA